MGRALVISLAVFAVLVASPARAQSDNRSVLGKENPLLAAGADAIKAGRYGEGIRLTSLGLSEEDPTPFERAAALANLCAAHAADGDPDTAIDYCDESLSLNERNWRAFSNRSYAHYLKGSYAEAARDVEAAAEIAPRARQVRQIRALLNERNLRPQITMEDHQ